MSKTSPKSGDVRTRLIDASYRPPVVEAGDWLEDAIDGRVEVGGYSRGLLPWPRRMKTGKPSLILCGDLIRAVRTESALAIAHHFGVSSVTVAKWRVALGVDRKNNEGTVMLYKGLAPSLASTGSAVPEPDGSSPFDQDTAPMPRSMSGTAETSAERKRKMRLRQVARGQVRCSIELSIEAREKVDRAADATGRTRTEVVNALILESLP